MNHVGLAYEVAEVIGSAIDAVQLPLRLASMPAISSNVDLLAKIAGEGVKGCPTIIV